MSLMEWNDNLDVHVNEMNDQHKGLLDIMNKLYNQFNEGAPYATLHQLLTELGEKTTVHFAEEEKYMESISYPDLSKHKIIHKQLLEKFGEHVEKFESTKELDKGFFDFLKLWLQSHIMGIDAKYGQMSNAA
jgi:hemerythrin